MTRLLSTRTQVVVLLVVLLAGAGVLGSVLWVSASARAAEQVSASWRLDCPSAARGGDGVVRSRPGWRCEVQVRVVNDGDHTVEVTALSGRRVGLDSRIEARALPSDATPLARVQQGADAVWDTDLAVPPHASRTVTVGLGWRREGCDAAGTLTLRPWATVRFEVLGREHAVTSPQPLVLRTYDDPHDERACPGGPEV